MGPSSCFDDLPQETRALFLKSFGIEEIDF